jgi:hypothetical protein
MARTQHPDNFDAMTADHRSSSHYFEEPDGTLHTWAELSAEGKLGYLARDAAYCDVPFERFAAAVGQDLGDLPAAAREEAALRLTLASAKEQHAVARLLPPDERTESTPLAEPVKEVLEAYAAGPEPDRHQGGRGVIDRLVASLRECKGMLERVQGEWEGPWEPPWSEIQRAAAVLDEAARAKERDARLDYMLYDAHQVEIGHLEAFGDAFERLARTKEQKQLAAGFQEFVREFTSARTPSVFRQMLAERAGEGGPPQKERDQGIDR